ncbi:hypothetical protein ACI5KX_12515 [Erythrobacter sp. GH1-10]|uniref:hypothetical protein n=1 Tax=Erythrobacter sp. GH1-10 TaxID=3349334 RepID=UPI0038781D20
MVSIAVKSGAASTVINNGLIGCRRNIRSSGNESNITLINTANGSAIVEGFGPGVAFGANRVLDNAGLIQTNADNASGVRVCTNAIIDNSGTVQSAGKGHSA